jgi:hypothetical protein
MTSALARSSQPAALSVLDGGHVRLDIPLDRA